jgi:transposase
MVKACVIKEMLQQIRNQNDLLTALVEMLEREDSPAPEVQAVAAAAVLPEKAFLSVNEAVAESGYTRNYGVFFQRRFETRLLKEIPKGYTIIMDNARFHRKKQLRGLAGGKVRLLFLPPYSPDYNPIEKSWANMKRFLGNNLRGFQSLDSAILSFFHLTEY